MLNAIYNIPLFLVLYIFILPGVRKQPKCFSVLHFDKSYVLLLSLNLFVIFFTKSFFLSFIMNSVKIKVCFTLYLRIILFTNIQYSVLHT